MSGKSWSLITYPINATAQAYDFPRFDDATARTKERPNFAVQMVIDLVVSLPYAKSTIACSTFSICSPFSTTIDNGNW